MRLLLGLEHVHAHQQEGANAGGHPLMSAGWELRVAGLFVIFAASMCSLITLWFRSTNTVLPRLLRAFSGGVITALALVHIVPEALEQLDGLPLKFPVPVGGCAILAGILLLVILDSTLAGILAPESYRNELQEQEEEDKDSSTCAVTSTEHHSNSTPKKGADFHCHRIHSSSSENVSEAAAKMKTIRQGVTAVTMELGCIFHSVIIGIGVGVITGDKQLVLTLITALAIHQGLEGLALGSVLALTSFSTLKKVLMLFVYSVTTPAGIAIGITIASTYDATSLTNRAVQGGLNGVSGGMLLYIGLNQLLAEEFSKGDLTVRPGLRFCMYLAVVLGAGAMCALGIWA